MVDGALAGDARHVVQSVGSEHYGDRGVTRVARPCSSGFTTDFSTPRGRSARSIESTPLAEGNRPPRRGPAMRPNSQCARWGSWERSSPWTRPRQLSTADGSLTRRLKLLPTSPCSGGSGISAGNRPPHQCAIRTLMNSSRKMVRMHHHQWAILGLSRTEVSPDNEVTVLVARAGRSRLSNPRHEQTAS